MKKETMTYNVKVNTGRMFKLRMWLVSKLMYVKYKAKD